MNFNQNLELSQCQKLIITPSLKQSLDILNMSKLELDEEIKNQVEENPLLESKEVSDINWEEYIKNMQINFRFDKNEVNYNSDNEINLENIISYSSNLYEHLHFQISLYKLSNKEKKVCEYIIDSLDEDGYLRYDENEIINNLKIDKDVFESCLYNIQQLKPSGVGARDLSECLMIQLTDFGFYDEILENIINNDLNLISNNNYKDISKKYKISMQKCVYLINIIKNLDPKPGRIYSIEKSIYVKPDVRVEKIENEILVFDNYNDKYKLKINNFYKEILKNTGSDEDAKTYIKEKLNLATNLIESIKSRKTTILKIAQVIVKYQSEFFEKGTKYIKPMTMKDIAYKLDCHESTISRGINGKYMQTSFGTFEFKYFFSSALDVSNEEQTSSTSVKKMINDLIKLENKQKPLSDEKIAKLLQDKKINIARRTVAKYREEIGILSSSKRKKY